MLRYLLSKLHLARPSGRGEDGEDGAASTGATDILREDAKVLKKSLVIWSVEKSSALIFLLVIRIQSRYLDSTKYKLPSLLRLRASPSYFLHNPDITQCSRILEPFTKSSTPRLKGPVGLRKVFLSHISLKEGIC